MYDYSNYNRAHASQIQYNPCLQIELSNTCMTDKLSYLILDKRPMCS